MCYYAGTRLASRPAKNDAHGVPSGTQWQIDTSTTYSGTTGLQHLTLLRRKARQNGRTVPVLLSSSYSSEREQWQQNLRSRNYYRCKIKVIRISSSYVVLKNNNNITLRKKLWAKDDRNKNILLKRSVLRPRIFCTCAMCTSHFALVIVDVVHKTKNALDLDQSPPPSISCCTLYMLL